jgi:hypothetical protein
MFGSDAAAGCWGVYGVVLVSSDGAWWRCDARRPVVAQAGSMPDQPLCLRVVISVRTSTFVPGPFFGGTGDPEFTFSLASLLGSASRLVPSDGSIVNCQK